jgi:acyl-CoA dehydrogenase
MKRLIFDEEHDMFRDSVRRFMQTEIEPQVESWRQAGICDKSAFLKAGKQGLLCMWADGKYGGLGMTDFRFEQVVIEETIGMAISVPTCIAARGPYIGCWVAKLKRLIPA